MPIFDVFSLPGLAIPGVILLVLGMLIKSSRHEGSPDNDRGEGAGDALVLFGFILTFIGVGSMILSLLAGK